MSEISGEAVDAEFDSLMLRPRAGIELSPEAVRLARLMPVEARRSRRQHKRWIVGIGLTASLTAVGATAAVAAPLLLSPIPGYSKIVELSYGVSAGQPGVSCSSIIAIKPTPDDPEFNATLVSQFRDFLTSQDIEVTVPAAAREPFTGEQSQLEKWPGAAALNESYSKTMSVLFAEFDSKVGDVSHSLMIQDQGTCEGHQ